MPGRKRKQTGAAVPIFHPGDKVEDTSTMTKAERRAYYERGRKTLSSNVPTNFYFTAIALSERLGFPSVSRLVRAAVSEYITRHQEEEVHE